MAQHSSRPGGRRPRRLARPRLDHLEDRTAPALFTVHAPVGLGGTKNFGCIATGDFNGDGNTDMVLTNYGTAGPGNNAGGNTLSVVLGHGDGTFGSATTITVGTDQYVSFVAVGDLNGDGKQDLAVVSNNEDSTGELRIYFGNGSGGFSLSSQGAVSTGSSNACWVGIANMINGDTRPDVVVCGFGNSDEGQTTVFGNNATVFQDDGTGSVNLIATVEDGISFIPTALALGDFDGDGNMDIAATVPGVPPDSTSAQPDGTVQLFTGNGAGGFTVGNSFDSGGSLPEGIQIGNFNGDGLPDLVVSNAGDPDSANFYQNFGSNSTIGVAINSGGGNFNTSTLTAGIGVSGSKSVFAVTAADFDMDGKTDIAAVLYGSPATGANVRVLEYKGNGAGSFTADPGSPFATTATDGQYLVAAPIDANASPDIVYCNADGDYGVLTNNTVTAPTATITKAAGQTDPTNSTSINYSVVFSEAVTGFTSAGVDLSGSTDGGAGLSAAVTPVDASHYTVTVTGMPASSTGTVVAKIIAGAATGVSDGQSSLASTATSVGWDYIPPTVTINQAAGQADPATTSPIQFTVTFSEAVTGFTGSDVSFAGSTLSGLSASVSGSGASYMVSVTGMAGNGTVVASIPASSVTDPAGNPNAASTSTDNSVTFGSAPAVTVNQAAGQADPTNGTSISYSVIFSTGVTGFTSAGVDLSGSTNGGAGLSASVAPVDSSHYTVTVTGMPAGSTGTVVAKITAGAATAIVGGQSSLASTSTDNSVTWDYIAPAVTVNQAVGQADPTIASPIQFTVTFSEPVVGFNGSKVSFAGSGAVGTLSASVSGSGPTYTVSVTGMSATGAVVVTVPPGAVTDPAGNGNTASTGTDNSVTYLDQSPIQFSQAVFNTPNGGDPATPGFTTITVTRSGLLNQAVSVDYATSDGTAGPLFGAGENGDDYTAVSGTLSWAANDATPKTFTIPITRQTQSEWNEGVHLTLSNPTGNALLGPQAAADLVIAKHNPKGNGTGFTDADGDQVVVKLSGPGQVLYYLTDGHGPIGEIDLSGTDPTKSVLSIKVTRPKGGTGDGRVGVGEIDLADGTAGHGMKSLALAKADLTGAGINFNGYLGSLVVNNVADGAAITVNATEGPPKVNGTINITAGVIGDETAITVAGAPLGRLTATSVGVGSVTAPSIGAINIKGKPKTRTTAAISGDFKSDLTTTAGGIKSFRAAGNVSGVMLQVGGNVGSFVAGTFLNSSLYAGYTGADDGSGTGGAGFYLPATVTSFRVTGRNQAFTNSYVIAHQVNKVNLMSVDSNAPTTYGIVGNIIKTVMVTLPVKLVYPLGDTLGSFQVQIV